MNNVHHVVIILQIVEISWSWELG